MKLRKTKKRFVASIENASILRKFTTLFIVMSILPMCVLFYIYFQMEKYGAIKTSTAELNIGLTFVVLGVLLGWGTMRTVLKKVIELTEANREALANVLDQKDFSTLGEGGENEIALLTQSFQLITQRLEENVRSLQLAKKKLHSIMAKVGHGITSLQSINKFLELILETVTDALLAKVGVLMLLDEKTNEIKISVVHSDSGRIQGVIGSTVNDTDSFQKVIKSRRPAIIRENLSGIIKGEPNAGEDLFGKNLICAPLFCKDQLLGLITVSGRETDSDFSDDEMNLLFALATQTAVAIKNNQLDEDIERTYFETVSALALAVDAKDTYSRGHLDRVAEYSVLIAEKLGLDDEDKRMLKEAARLHDLGKIGIPDELLTKDGPLTDQEWVLMRKHPEIGESIIRPVRSLECLCDIIRHHHECLDGSGYPDGLSGDEITPLVRIASVADIYDALTTDRSYREKITAQKAGRILREMEKKLDQDIVEAFLEVLYEKGSS